MSPPEEQDPARPPRPVAGPGRSPAISASTGSSAAARWATSTRPSSSRWASRSRSRCCTRTSWATRSWSARFKREAKSASLLNHPNSIQIIDSGQDRDGTLYIAMELLTGRDLAQVIRDDFPLPLPRVVRIMSQVLSALDEAHAQGVIHRDLKPSNIMLIERRDEKDFVKVCDFGIAKATLSDGEDDRAAMLTIQGLVCGTPEYMSPEQARAELLDGRADLYSAAVILYQLVTGDIPFRADSPMGIVSRHLAEPPVPPSRRRPRPAHPAASTTSSCAAWRRTASCASRPRSPSARRSRRCSSATSGPPTPLPPSVRASMPTARDISGADAIGTAHRSRCAAAGQPFGTTADLTRTARAQRSTGHRRSRRWRAGRRRLGRRSPRVGATRKREHAAQADTRPGAARPRPERRGRRSQPPPPAAAPAPAPAAAPTPRRRRRRPAPRAAAPPRVRRRARARTAHDAASRARGNRHPPRRPSPRRPPRRPRPRRRRRRAAPPSRRARAAARAARARCWPRPRSCWARARSATPARAARRPSA